MEIFVVGYHETLEAFEQNPQIARSFCRQLVKAGVPLQDEDLIILDVSQVAQLSDAACIDISKAGYPLMILKDIDIKNFEWSH